MRFLLLPLPLLWVLTGLVGAAAADAPTPLPDPLTLGDALRLADRVHPDVVLSAARRDAADAALEQVRADSGTRLDLVGELRAIDPSDISPDRSSNDSLARLVLSKRLYDFGFSDAREQAAGDRLAGAEWGYLDARQRHRLAVMRAYFDVLLADLTYARENEHLSIVFIAFDRGRDRSELGQTSDVELLRLESEFEAVRHRWIQSQSRQRLTRARLAQLLNRPDELSANLVMPVDDAAEQLPAVEELLAEVLAGNPRLKALRARVTAAEQALVAARKAHGPVLRGELGAGVYSRDLGSRHPVQAGLVLEVPLYTGGASDAAIAKARAELATSRAELNAAELAVRNELVSARLAMDDQEARMRQVGVLGDYRELYLDRSRALYEMEVRTDLGDSMVQMSTVRLEHARALFDGMMARARLAALAGKLIDDGPHHGADKDKPKEEVAP